MSDPDRYALFVFTCRGCRRTWSTVGTLQPNGRYAFSGSQHHAYDCPATAQARAELPKGTPFGPDAKVSPVTHGAWVHAEVYWRYQLPDET